MNPSNLNRFASVVLVAGMGLGAVQGFAQSADAYKIVKTGQQMGSGRIDYVYADNDERKLYVPRGGEVLVFDEDTLKSVGAIPKAQAHGVAVDPKSHHGFASSNPVAMWDSKTLEPIKSIKVEGRPDAILFEPLTERVYVFSHATPNATVLDAKDGSIVGAIDLGGAPEQAASDEKGHVYVNLEDKDSVAVIDVSTMKLSATYSLGGKGGGPAGLAFDAKNRVLFAFCAEPAVCVALSADDGKILGTMPIGEHNDSAVFNPATMEAFGSQRDGTLTVIKETSPTTFEVAQNVKTKVGAKTCTLDTKNNQVILITLEQSNASNPKPTPASSGSGESGQRGNRNRNSGPAMLDILVVGK